MDVQVEKTEAYLCKVSISIPADDVEDAFARAFRKVSKGVQIPGFRPGKAPRTLIERQYAPQIAEEVRTQLVEETLFRAIDEAKVMPVSMPRLQLGHLNRNAIFAYTAEVEVRPEIALQKHEGLTYPPHKAVVEDSQVQAELAAMQDQAAQVVPVLDRDVVQDSDVVAMDYVGSIDGVPFEGGMAENALVDISGGGYIAGFAEALVGAKVPGELSFDVTFPEDYNAAHLAGKKATFVAQLKELKKREGPALDDEFAKDMGEESLEALQTKIREQLQSRAESDSDNARRGAVLRNLIEVNPFPLPPSMLEGQLDRVVEGAKARFERMTGQKVQLNDEQVAALRQSSRADAEFQVRSGLLLVEVAKAANIEVSPEEVTADVERIAADAGSEAQRARAFYDDPERREELRYALLEDKVVKHLIACGTEQEEAAELPQAAASEG